MLTVAMAAKAAAERLRRLIISSSWDRRRGMRWSEL
jgi:hypothetical protein